MNRLGCAVLLLALALVAFLPIVHAAGLQRGLEALGLPPDVAFLIFVSFFVGSAIHIPVFHRAAGRIVRSDPLAVLGLEGMLPRLETRSERVTVAVNVGGCLIPLALVVYQVGRIVALAPSGDPAAVPAEPSPQGVLLAMFLASGVTAFVSWKLARVVSGVGIAVPGVVPGVVAGASALLLASESAAPVALVAGVLGPLVGACLLHLRDLEESPVGLASLGGAGTFDGIVLACVLAATLG